MQATLFFGLVATKIFDSLFGDWCEGLAKIDRGLGLTDLVTEEVGRVLIRLVPRLDNTSTVMSVVTNVDVLFLWSENDMSAGQGNHGFSISDA